MLSRHEIVLQKHLLERGYGDRLSCIVCYANRLCNIGEVHLSIFLLVAIEACTVFDVCLYLIRIDAAWSWSSEDARMLQHEVRLGHIALGYQFELVTV